MIFILCARILMLYKEPAIKLVDVAEKIEFVTTKLSSDRVPAQNLNE